MGLIESILAGLVIALISAIAGKHIAEKKLDVIINRMQRIDLSMVRIEQILNQLDDMKNNEDLIFERLRTVENKVSVLEHRS